MVARTIVSAAIVMAAGSTAGGYALIVGDPSFSASAFAGHTIPQSIILNLVMFLIAIITASQPFPKLKRMWPNAFYNVPPWPCPWRPQLWPDGIPQDQRIPPWPPPNVQPQAANSSGPPHAAADNSQPQAAKRGRRRRRRSKREGRKGRGAGGRGSRGSGRGEAISMEVEEVE